MREAAFAVVEWPAAASLGPAKQLEMAAAYSLLGVAALDSGMAVPVASGEVDTKFYDPCTAEEAVAGSMPLGVEPMA